MPRFESKHEFIPINELENYLLLEFEALLHFFVNAIILFKI